MNSPTRLVSTAFVTLTRAHYHQQHKSAYTKPICTVSFDSLNLKNETKIK